MTKRNWLILLLVLPGLITALVLAGQRYSLESHNKAVELALDYDELQNLSASSGTPMPELFERFKAAGVSSIAIGDTPLRDLVATGQVAYRERISQGGPVTEILVPDADLRERVRAALISRLDPKQIDPSAPTDPISVHAAPETLNLMGIGLSPDAVRAVRASGLGIVARLQNDPAMTSRAVGAALLKLRIDGIDKVIFSGDEVLGFRGLVEDTANQLKSLGIVYGSVEFSKQRGDAGMSRYLDGQFVRVHSIPIAEMATMSPGTAIERFARGVKERSIRLCYVRLLETTGDDSVKADEAFIIGIRRSVTSAGYTMGLSHPFGDTGQSPALLVPAALSVASGAVLLLSSLLTVSAMVQFGLLLAAFIMFTGLILVGGTGKELTALTAALVFPTLGVLRVYGPYLGPEISGAFRHPALRSTSRFVRASAYSLTGAVLIAGMLGTRTYMTKVDQFMGIKAAHLFPLLVVVFVMAAGLPIMNQPFPAVWQRMKANLREIGSNPLFIWQALALVFAVGLIGFALLRTGNDPGIGVSGIELKFRAILDKVMVVRPRTKEFLIGHPALILGAAFLFARRRSIGLPLLALGVLGQVSLLNTFCHIHTPLMLTAVRAFNGLVLGVIVGLAAWWFIGKPIVRATTPFPGKPDEK